VIRYTVEAEPAVEADVEAAFDWYEGEEPQLGFEFLAELRVAYERIVDHPFGYQDIRSGIRRALTRRFPYAVYFSVEGETIVVVAVLSTARDPAEWQRRS
jgi:plasmid stabilization system protein ParE